MARTPRFMARSPCGGRGDAGVGRDVAAPGLAKCKQEGARPHSTKRWPVLRAPTTSDELLRPRLRARFHAAAADRVVLVVAPAGYGKSIALRQYLDTCGEPATSFNVRSEHATLLGFVRGFAEAFRETAPALAQTLVQTYSAVQASENAGVQLAEWVQQHIEHHEGIVAIDDLHL